MPDDEGAGLRAADIEAGARKRENEERERRRILAADELQGETMGVVRRGLGTRGAEADMGPQTPLPAESSYMPPAPGPQFCKPPFVPDTPKGILLDDATAHALAMCSGMLRTAKMLIGQAELNRLHHEEGFARELEGMAELLKRKVALRQAEIAKELVH